MNKDNVKENAMNKENVTTVENGVFKMGLVTVTVPVGSYPAEFVGWEPFEENKEMYGPAVALKWRITGGECEDKVAWRIVSRKTSAKTNLFKFVTALKGAKPGKGEEICLEDFVGVKGQIIVEEAESGGTRVGLFLRDA